MPGGDRPVPAAGGALGGQPSGTCNEAIAELQELRIAGAGGAPPQLPAQELKHDDGIHNECGNHIFNILQSC